MTGDIYALMKGLPIIRLFGSGVSLKSYTDTAAEDSLVLPCKEVHIDPDCHICSELNLNVECSNDINALISFWSCPGICSSIAVLEECTKTSYC